MTKIQPSYIERKADAKAIELLDRNELCLVLAPRQTGKPSIMFLAMPCLEKLGIRAGIGDTVSISGIRMANQSFLMRRF